MNDNRKFVCFDVFGRRLELCVSKVETLQVSRYQNVSIAISLTPIEAIIMEMGFIILPIRHLWDEITTSLSDDRVPFIFRDSRNLGHDILNDDDWKATICQSGTVVKVFMKPNPDKDPVEQLCLEGKRVTWYRDVSLTEAPNAIGVNFTDPHGRHSILPRVVCTTYEVCLHRLLYVPF